jgi:hypothetical protein
MRASIRPYRHAQTLSLEACRGVCPVAERIATRLDYEVAVFDPGVLDPIGIELELIATRAMTSAKRVLAGETETREVNAPFIGPNIADPAAHD